MLPQSSEGLVSESSRPPGPLACPQARRRGPVGTRRRGPIGTPGGIDEMQLIFTRTVDETA
jgi:hypothetical protein